ncbi:MAG: molybdopterin-dependent oxidoreductase [Dehalococcoidia bacterium]
MKTTRRGFLKWSGIGVLGTVAFAGCGIPEGEMLVQSSAKMPEDLVSGLEAWYATACASCGEGEGIIVRVIEGRAIKIEGNPDHPVSRGKTSARCQAGLQSLYNPDRLTGPMRRTGTRGSGQFGPISWNEALDELAGHLQNYDPTSVALLTEPLRGTLGTVVRRFMDAYGGRHMALESMEGTPLRAAMQGVFGQDRLPYFDIAKADHVLSFGADFLSTWLSPVQYSLAYGEFRRGRPLRGTLVQVEPRMSMTAANADRWVYINPGMEGVLALSIAHVLIAEYGDRIDTAAAETITGPRGLAALEAFAPEAVTNSLGISVETINKLADGLAHSERSLVLGGGPAAAHTNGLFNLTAIFSLNYLLGSVGHTGGVLFNADSPLDDLAGTAKVSPFNEWQGLAGNLGDGVKMVMVHGANPVHGLPASIGFSEALNRVDTLVSFSSFMDETTAMADLILPDHVYLEAWGDDVPEPGPGYQAVTLQQPVVYPFTGTRSFGDVLLQTAGRLGGAVAQELPWPTMKDALRDTAQKLQALQRGSVVATDFEAFWNTVLQRGGWWDVNAKGPAPAGGPPRLGEQREDPEFSTPAGGEVFFLIPFSSNALTDGRGANLPWLQASPDPLTTATWRTWAEINSKKAEALGIEEGDELEIRSPSGTIKALAYLHPMAHPEVISIPTGQGHTEYGNFEVGDDLNRSLVGKDRGSNVLDVLSPLRDEKTGALAWAATKVTINKTGNREQLPKFEGTVPPAFPEEIIPISAS